ncbi:hypothetical protein BDV93DRAFT_561664 [Ceratobasidium sp. AG-I]|nr:hypothetical protein BDV93DRAFT_561664 [Ceratobasidium sp. AG-I]
MYMQKHGPRSTSFWIPLRFLVVFHAVLMLFGGFAYAALVLYIYSDTNKRDSLELSDSEKGAFIVTGVLYMILVFVFGYGLYGAYRAKKTPVTTYSKLFWCCFIIQIAVFSWFLVAIFTSDNGLLKQCQRVFPDAGKGGSGKPLDPAKICEGLGKLGVANAVWGVCIILFVQLRKCFGGRSIYGRG